MAETWRYVDCGSVDAFENQAAMAVLVRSTLEDGRPALQTSVWGATHLNVGWFDDVDTTTDLEACRRLGVQVIRRPMAGGGTAFYDEDCSVMWGLLRPSTEVESLDAELSRFQPIVLDALGRLGLGEVRFERADLRWRDDRKLGGMSANDFGPITSVGGFLNVRRPDVDLYLKVVRIPDEKFRDKAVKDLREYVCTAEEVTDRPVTYTEFRDALLSAVNEAGIVLEEEGLRPVERSALGRISTKIASDDALRRVSSERFRSEHEGDGRRVGFGNFKGRKLCRAGVALDDAGVVVAAMMAGDMHVAPPDILDRIAERLSGLPSEETTMLRDRVSSVFDSDDVHQADVTTGVTTDDLVHAIERAIAEATEAT